MKNTRKENRPNTQIDHKLKRDARQTLAFPYFFFFWYLIYKQPQILYRWIDPIHAAATFSIEPSRGQTDDKTTKENIPSQYQ